MANSVRDSLIAFSPFEELVVERVELVGCVETELFVRFVGQPRGEVSESFCKLFCVHDLPPGV